MEEVLSRCNNPNVSSYKYYGGKGVTVCERWSYPGDEGFLNFIEDMGERPKGTTLDRIDVNGNYCKDNFGRWLVARYNPLTEQIMFILSIKECCLQNHSLQKSLV